MRSVVVGPLAELSSIRGLPDGGASGVPIPGGWGAHSVSGDGRFAFGVADEVLTDEVREALLAVRGVQIVPLDGWRESVGWRQAADE